MAGESSPNLYEVLRVAPDATADEVRAAWRRLAREHHPDVAGAGSQAMALINQAYEVLSDPQRRARYDQARAARPQARKPGRVELPADRARRRLLWAAGGFAGVLLAAGALMLGLRSTEEAVLPPAVAQPAPPQAASRAAGPVATEDGLRLIPSRTIGTPPAR